METLKSFFIFILIVLLVLSVSDNMTGSNQGPVIHQAEIVEEILIKPKVISKNFTGNNPTIEELKEQLKEDFIKSKKNLRQHALMYRLNFSQVQCEAIEAINENADLTNLNRKEVENTLRLSYKTAGVLTDAQIDGYFEVMRDYEQFQHEDYTNQMVSEIRLLLGLTEEKLDEVYSILYEMPEDTEAALSLILDEKQIGMLRTFYEKNN